MVHRLFLSTTLLCIIFGCIVSGAIPSKSQAEIIPLFERFASIVSVLQKRDVKILHLELRKNQVEQRKNQDSSKDTLGLATLTLRSPSRLWRLTPVMMLANGGMSSRKVAEGRETILSLTLEPGQAHTASISPASSSSPASLPGTVTSYSSAFRNLPLEISALQVSIKSLSGQPLTSVTFEGVFSSDELLNEIVTLETFLSNYPRCRPVGLTWTNGTPNRLTFSAKVIAQGLPSRTGQKALPPPELMELRQIMQQMGFDSPKASMAKLDEGLRKIEFSGALQKTAHPDEVLGRLLLLPGLASVESLGWELDPAGGFRFKGVLVFAQPVPVLLPEK